MNYYVDTLFDDIKGQAEQLMAASKRLQFMIPDLDGQDAVTLRNKLSNLAYERQWELCFKVAEACFKKNTWSDEDRAALEGSKALGNLTQFRNDVERKQQATLQVFVGVALVTDKGSLADFYQCGEEQLLKGVMQGSFLGWAKRFLEEGNDTDTKAFAEILKTLYRRTSLQTVSRWLDGLDLSHANSPREAIEEALRNLEVFGLPNLSGSLRKTKGKSRPFAYYANAADAFLNYDLFLEASKRKKYSKGLDDLRKEDNEEIPEERYAPAFADEAAFLDALEKYIVDYDLSHLEALKKCDFAYIVEELLAIKPKKETKPTKETVHKLAGAPVEVVLRALWMCLESLGTRMPTKIVLEGKRFMHDYAVGAATADEAKTVALENLKRLLGGVDALCESHIQLNLEEDADAVVVESRLLHDNLTTTSSKQAEPSFEFWVTVTDDHGDEKQMRFALKLPALHPYRLADDLLKCAAVWLNLTSQKGGGCALPVFHLEYYKELMMAREEEEICRVLSHCIRECNADDGFVTNIFTPEWQQYPSVTSEMRQQLQELTSAYREFVDKVETEGLYGALALGSTPRIITAYTSALTGFSGESFHHPKIAAMLMRSFLFTERKEEPVSTWGVATYEPSGIVTILHPALLEMLQARIAFLFSAFSQAAVAEFQKEKDWFKKQTWAYYVDLAEMKMPLTGLLVDPNNRFEVCSPGHALVHRIGRVTPEATLATTRFMERYDSVDDEDITDAELFRESSESRHLARILTDYCKMHTSAKDGLSLAIYRNDDIQPVLAALDRYVRNLADEKLALGVSLYTRQERYTIKVVFFSESSDVSGVANWISQWQDFLEAKEDDSHYYGKCAFSLAHRVVSATPEGYAQFAETIANEVDADVFAFYNFIKPGSEGCKFQEAEPFDATRDALKFPILEQAQCSNTEPDTVLKRTQIVSNRQFRISAAHVETVAYLREQEQRTFAAAPTTRHPIVLATGDFEPWQKIIDKAHEASEWVVCVDASIDEALIGYKHGDHEATRELIGYGSGVGLHGESNYTISTQKYCMDDIRKMLLANINTVYAYGEPKKDEVIANRLLKEAKTLAGISLIRALGQNTYIRDFMAYCLMHRLLPINEEDCLCDKLFSIDAYRHWFDQASAENRTHPDLLWLRASIRDGRIHLDAKLIECKMAGENELPISKAKEQIRNGLKVLSDVFRPKACDASGVGRPDQRYWYLQLHRMIASCAHFRDNTASKGFFEAMERLTAGDFSISWGAGVFAFWTDSVSDSLVRKEAFAVPMADGEELEAPVFVAGYDFIHNLCVQDNENRPKMDQETTVWRPMADTETASSLRAIPTTQDEPEPDSYPTDEEDDTLPEPSSSAPEVSTIKTVEDNGNETTAPNVSEPPAMPERPPIPQRIYLGETKRGGEKIYWEFGHPNLTNRHFLIFGNSGSGKTYAIQAILCELGRQAQNSLIVDYTQGFLPGQLQAKTNEVLVPVQHFVKDSKLPINPFMKQSQNVGYGKIIEEGEIDVAKRVTSIFDTVYHLGKQQASILIDAIAEGVKKQGEDFTLDTMLEIVQSFLGDNLHPKSSARTLISALKPFVDEKPFSKETFGWDRVFSDMEKHCHVFQMAMMDQSSYRALTEFILWDLYAFVRSVGKEAYPRVVVLDEVQNLDQRLEAPLGRYLTEGRKFGISLIAATQTLGNLKPDEQARLFQAAHKLFFQPSNTELNQYAKLVKQAANEGTEEEWRAKLSSLARGECLSIGPALDERTGELKNKVRLIRIAALENRGF